MSKTTNRNVRSGKPWTGADISRLIVMAERQVPATRIAAKLRRSEGAVRAEAARQRVLLAPSDRSPTAKPPYGGVTAARATGSRPVRHAVPAASRSRAPRDDDSQQSLF